MMDAAARRQAGLLLPLFSCPSTSSWGIGDIADLPHVAAWLAEAGLRVLQLLPLNEMAPHQQSPYSAISAMAIDPIYLRLTDIADIAALGGEGLLSADERRLLDEARHAPRVDYAAVRQVKEGALAAAFRRFVDMEWTRDTERTRAFKRFVSEQAWWIEDYALFRAIHADRGEEPWTSWPEPLQRREPAAIDRARRELGDAVLFRQYLQWLAFDQWQRARAAARPVAVYGDLPFMVDGDSADVWARPQQFRLDASTGVPPDAFSASGQDWGMPVYDWPAMARDNFHWLRERARRSADLFDGYRIDHLVGFYRTYARPRNGDPPFFTPADEPAQLALGEAVLNIFRQAGAEIIAEDLGTVPDFVRASLARLGVPGFRVFRWEREWHVEGQPFRDPTQYSKRSVAASGTHDTEPLVVWWQGASDEERQKVSVLPTIQRLTNGAALTGASPDPYVRDVILEALFAAASDLLVVPVQDVFGWSTRINEPASVTTDNWTYKLPWPTDRLLDVPEATERRLTLARWANHHARR